jgi:Glycosyltransferase family 87
MILKTFQQFSKARWLFATLLLIYSIKILVQGPGDFATYYGASQALSESKMIYNVRYIVNPLIDEWCEYSYSPFFAFILMPISWLPIKAADAIWLIFNIFLLFRVFDLIIYFLDIKKIFNLKEYRWWVFGILLFSARFILYNFDLSQVTILILYGVLESLRLTIKGQWIWAGVILATVISIKIMPLVMLPYLFWRRYWQTGLTTIGFIGLFLLLPSVMYGWQDYFWMLQDWVDVLNPSHDDFTTQQNVVAEGIHSLSAFIPAFFTNEVTRYGIDRHFILLDKETMIKVLNLCRLLFIFLTLIFLETKPFVVINNKKRLFWELSYLMIAMILIFPHQQKYAFFLILPACAYILSYLMVIKKTSFSHINKPFFYTIILLFSMVWLLTTASTDGIIGRQLYNYGQYFKFITWGTMLLIIPLYLSKPNDSEHLSPKTVFLE